MRFLVLTAACVLLSALASDARAGGDNGGTKNSAQIRVTNNSNEIAAVIVDVGDNTDFEDMQAFLDAGGKILQPGRSANFKVTRGQHTLSAALVDDEGLTLGDPDQVTVNAQKGTIAFNVSGTDDAQISQH